MGKGMGRGLKGRCGRQERGAVRCSSIYRLRLGR